MNKNKKDLAINAAKHLYEAANLFTEEIMKKDVPDPALLHSLLCGGMAHLFMKMRDFHEDGIEAADSAIKDTPRIIRDWLTVLENNEIPE